MLSKVYASYKPGFPLLPTLLVTKVRPSDEAYRGKLFINYKLSFTEYLSCLINCTLFLAFTRWGKLTLPPWALPGAKAKQLTKLVVKLTTYGCRPLWGKAAAKG